MLGIQMRVHHIQTLAWAGALVLLAGAGWVAVQFLAANRNKSKPVTVEWPDAAGAADISPRWPGDLAKFRQIWDTPLNGKVPPPPPPPDTTVKAKLDPGEEFRKKCELLMAWAHSDPDSSLVVVKLDGKQQEVRPGARVTMSVEGKSYAWQLRGVSVVGGAAKALFTCRDWTPPKRKDGSTPPSDVEISGASVPNPPWETNPSSPFRPALDGPFRVEVREGEIDREAYLDASGEWIVPDEELAWYGSFGESKVLSRMKTQDTPSGVRILTHPGEGTPVGSGRGIAADDVVKSINGVEMRSMGDITSYLRGEGRGLRRYEVVIERAGAVRTVVYNVSRRTRS